MLLSKPREIYPSIETYRTIGFEWRNAFDGRCGILLLGTIKQVPLMHGRKAADLLEELRKSSWLPPYNVSTCRSFHAVADLSHYVLLLTLTPLVILRAGFCCQICCSRNQGTSGTAPRHCTESSNSASIGPVIRCRCCCLSPKYPAKQAMCSGISSQPFASNSGLSLGGRHCRF